IGDVLEGEEGHPDRQRELEARRARSGKEAQELSKEVEVFEEAEQQQVQPDRERYEALASRAQEGLAKEPVDRDRGREQRHEAQVPPAIEDERERHQESQAPAWTEALDRPGQQQRRGQEN